MSDFKIEGLDKLLSQFESLKDLDTQSALLAGAYTLQKYSMENAPVDTGFLRNSHYSETTSEGAQMVVGAEYAFYVEMGTARMKAIPYVRPAIDEHTKDVINAVKQNLEYQIRGNV